VCTKMRTARAVLSRNSASPRSSRIGVGREGSTLCCCRQCASHIRRNHADRAKTNSGKNQLTLRRRARRLAVRTSNRSRDANAVTGAATRDIWFALVLVMVGMTVAVSRPDSSHLTYYCQLARPMTDEREAQAGKMRPAGIRVEYRRHALVQQLPAN
jgi:hypothetical protein